ncbi:uncharacterized protein MONOS_6615 [Monocercomonoides exilis]|uniref:uncharacterized protein n=1 Tax=Monocercomonoides exilis TaxID=2049356 RepID=UPI0035594E7F|nr:hypothetical protein MONOS_6615 [Monocercomonoides exilis]|eukprot:MONOS_6615.1-p1 / transcript=MONOS_6615.1 / gene=MONOS_6615 / organism=Monocercomonoides_exilis_PA203 / gene_product=unspecified product / transcript_product=unspecified product / location=Mono_scaffold00211:50812-51195(-) / protein_length=128 / sequence_SO=supercontig / SO=protein_coding / is_pseudo=false
MISGRKGDLTPISNLDFVQLLETHSLSSAAELPFQMHLQVQNNLRFDFSSSPPYSSSFHGCSLSFLVTSLQPHGSSGYMMKNSVVTETKGKDEALLRQYTEMQAHLAVCSYRKVRNEEKRIRGKEDV